jgi:hypothetical protein
MIWKEVLRVQILQFHQQNQVYSSNTERACKVIDDMGQTNYGPFRAWPKHEKLFVKMSVWIHNTNGHLLSKQLCFQTVLEVLIQILAVTTLTVVLPGFPQYLQENFKIGPQIRPQPIPSTSFLIHYSLIILACKAILHEKQTAPLYKPHINK